MGEAARRKRAGTYPVPSTPESDAAFAALMRDASPPPMDPAVRRFLDGHGHAADLTAEQRADVERMLEHEIALFSPCV